MKDVALFTRAWIEIDSVLYCHVLAEVALFTRAWIEMAYNFCKTRNASVALFTRAWIEIICFIRKTFLSPSRPLHEGVD